MCAVELMELMELMELSTTGSFPSIWILQKELPNSCNKW